MEDLREQLGSGSPADASGHAVCFEHRSRRAAHRAIPLARGGPPSVRATVSRRHSLPPRRGVWRDDARGGSSFSTTPCSSRRTWTPPFFTNRRCASFGASCISWAGRLDRVRSASWSVATTTASRSLTMRRNERDRTARVGQALAQAASSRCPIFQAVAPSICCNCGPMWRCACGLLAGSPQTQAGLSSGSSLSRGRLGATRQAHRGTEQQQRKVSPGQLAAILDAAPSGTSPHWKR